MTKTPIWVAARSDSSGTPALRKPSGDRQEDSALISRVDQARLEKLLADHDPYKVPPPDQAITRTPQVLHL